MTLVKRNQHLFPNVWNGIFDGELMDPSSFFGTTRRQQAAVNIIDNASHFDIEIEAPGYKKEDVSITLDDYTLIVEGTRGNQNEDTNNEEKNDTTRKFVRREFGAEHFKRSFNLPKTVDLEKIDAKYDAGILYLTIDKKEEAKNQGKRQILIH